jgi:hypothetical protein
MTAYSIASDAERAAPIGTCTLLIREVERGTQPVGSPGCRRAVSPIRQGRKYPYREQS